jgi:predicted transcriptional regulator
MQTLRVGIASYEEMKARTLPIARGQYTPAADEPKVWFRSAESLARVLSDRNRALLWGLWPNPRPSRWRDWRD